MLYFKLPFSSDLYTLQGEPSKDSLQFISFDEKKTLSFKGTLEKVSEKQILDSEFTSSQLTDSSELIPQTREQYNERLEEAIALIKEHKLDKLVLSRRKLIAYKELSLSKSFLNLTKAYPKAFSYVFAQGTESWIGAFSELLGEYDLLTGQFKTMSLAGTLPLEEEWEVKEIEEQAAVNRYMESVLSKYSSEIKTSETYSHPSGSIKHLRTDFSCQVNPKDLDALIQDLHPTPAVLGTPKDLCIQLLENLEPYPREFYGGYSRLKVGNKLYFFVTLRCAKLFTRSAHLFVGGGITAKSSVEKEFQETELKAQAIGNQLEIIS